MTMTRAILPLLKKHNVTMISLGSGGYADFDIIFDPFPTHHRRFTTQHAPGDVPYLVTMAIEC